MRRFLASKDFRGSVFLEFSSPEEAARVRSSTPRGSARARQEGRRGEGGMQLFENYHKPLAQGRAVVREWKSRCAAGETRSMRG